MLGPNLLEKPFTLEPKESTLTDLETRTSTSSFPPFRFIGWLISKFSPGSIKGSVFELIGATMGAGVLLIPYTFVASGLTFGIIQLCICAALSYYSATLLAKSADIAGKYGYFEVAAASYGNIVQFLVKVILFINNWGGCVVYTILITNFIGTSLDIFFDHNIARFLTDPNGLFWPPIFTTLIVLPLSLRRDLSALRFACLLGFIFILYLSIVVIYSCFALTNASHNYSQIKQFDFSGLGITFPTAIFSYAYHPNVLYVYDELQRPSYRRIKKVLLRSIMAACAVFAVIGSFGYIAFADNLDFLTEPRDILFSFAFRGWPVVSVIALLLIGITITLLMPLSIKPAKEALGELLFSSTPRIDDSPDELTFFDENEILEKKEPLTRHVLLVIAVVYSQMFVGMFIKSMASIIQILGATTLSLMCFNFPCMFYLKLDQSPKYAPNRILAHVVNILMAIIGGYSLYTTIVDN